ncbi:MAG: hypothetical protein AB8D52_01100 [Gammaproteobacteria bacterium]
MIKHFRLFFILIAISLFYSVEVAADGSIIDKIYHPYVQPQEKEFELRATFESNDRNNPTDGADTYRFAYGQSINDRWFSEFYLIGEKTPDDSFEIEYAEVEFLWQLTEQGEYSADWGMLFEIERAMVDQITEVSTTLLIERQWGSWVGTANLNLAFEWGSDIDNELETGLSMQTRYRYSRLLEPAVELYLGEDTHGIGPVLLGNIRLGDRKQLRWETGVIVGLSNDTPDTTFRFLIELEYY